MLQKRMRKGPHEDENFKAQLQVISQKRSGALPTYRLMSSEGPEHQKTFQIEVSINGVPYGTGKGRNKKEAEQRAAKEALETMAKDRAV